MPSKASNERAGKPVEGINEEMVVDESFPAAVKLGTDGEPLRDNTDLAENIEQATEFTDRVFSQDRCIFVLEWDLHQLG